MSALIQKLRDLRATVRSPAKPSLSFAVQQLLQRHARLKRGPNHLRSEDRHLPGQEVAPGVHYIEERIAMNCSFDMIPAAFAGMQPLAREHVLHFDTETTGLAGGTGTRAFMIGAADFIDADLRLRQLTITRLAAEHGMLRLFANWLNPDSVLVSYNGKSYDSPLLKTRFRLARLPDPISGLRHLDLLHPVRRRWKGAWENCRLATVERHVLGVVRDDDLPGSEAPAAWLTYLRGGSAANLRRVVHHNAQDLCSLAALLLHMAALNEDLSLQS